MNNDFKPILTLKNEWCINFLAKNIAINYKKKGFASLEKVKKVLKKLKKEFDIRTLKQLTNQDIEDYVILIKEKFDNKEIAGKTAQDYISTLNMIISYTNFVMKKYHKKNYNILKKINASEYGISRVSNYKNNIVADDIYEKFLLFLEDNFSQTGDIKYKKLQYSARLQREFGLLVKESFGLKLDTIQKALKSKKRIIKITKKDWSRCGWDKYIKIRTDKQYNLLKELKIFLKQEKIKNLGSSNNNENLLVTIKKCIYLSEAIRKQFIDITNNSFSYLGLRKKYIQDLFVYFWKEKINKVILCPLEYYEQELKKCQWNNKGKFYEAVKKYKIKSWYSYIQEISNLSILTIKNTDKEIRDKIIAEIGLSKREALNTTLGYSL